MKKTKDFFIATVMSLLIAVVIAVTMNACNKPSSTAPILPGNEQLTTTLLVISDPSHIYPTDTLDWSEAPNLWNSASTDAVTDTVHTFITLHQNHTYNIQIIILDSILPSDSANYVVSNEIIARENYHLFCFYDSTNQNDIYGTDQSSRAPSGWANVVVTNPNLDTNKPPLGPLPFGITDELITAGPTKGQLEIILRHQPDVKNGSCEPGSTDLDVYFNITVQ